MANRPDTHRPGLVWSVICYFPNGKSTMTGESIVNMFLFCWGPLKQIQVDTLQTMNNSELVNVDNP
jgi:hypothetical protein